LSAVHDLDGPEHQGGARRNRGDPPFDRGGAQVRRQRINRRPYLEQHLTAKPNRDGSLRPGLLAERLATGRGGAQHQKRSARNQESPAGVHNW
jgi:hypothetical protein